MMATETGGAVGDDVRDCDDVVVDGDGKD